MTSQTRGVPHVRRALAPTMGFRTILPVTLFALAVIPPAPAQGCAQCRDQISQTPTQTQKAYRRGILLLIVSAAGVFTAVLITTRRYR